MNCESDVCTFFLNDETMKDIRGTPINDSSNLENPEISELVNASLGKDCMNYDSLSDITNISLNIENDDDCHINMFLDEETFLNLELLVPERNTEKSGKCSLSPILT